LPLQRGQRLLHPDGDHLQLLHPDGDHLQLLHPDGDHLQLLHPDGDHLQLLQVQRKKAEGSGVRTGLTSGTYKSIDCSVSDRL
jgi:hypothetical protein